MATSRQRSAARRNIKKAATAARRKRTIAHLPKKTRSKHLRVLREAGFVWNPPSTHSAASTG